MDLGLANGRLFADMVGIGYDAAIVHNIVPGGGKLRLHYPAYIARATHLLALFRPRPFRITADGETIETEAWMAVIANTTHYARHWRVAPYAVADDGLLDLCLFQSTSAVPVLGQVLGDLANRHAHLPGVRHLRARSFRVECERPWPVQLDGDAAGETPVEVGVTPRALCVMVPAAVERRAVRLRRESAGGG